MNPTNLIPAPYRIAALALAAVLIYFTGYLKGAAHESAKAAAFEGGVVALGKAAAAHTAAVEARQRLNLERANHELKEANRAAADNAVRNYLRRNPRWLCNGGAGGGVLPGAAGSEPGDDGTGGKRLAAGIDAGFVQACARDAGKLGVWQTWAQRNGVPVE